MGKIIFLLLGVVALCGCGDADVTITNHRQVTFPPSVNDLYYFDPDLYQMTDVYTTFGADKIEARLKYGESISQTFHSAGYVVLQVSGYTGQTLKYGDVQRDNITKSFEIGNGLFSDKKYEIDITNSDITSSEK